MLRLSLMLGLALMAGIPGCGPSKDAKSKIAPAKIEHPKESDIYRVVLTAKAEERLQISTEDVQLKAVPRTGTVGGMVTIPDGASLVVTAPLTGLLLPVKDGLVVPGNRIKAGAEVFRLRQLLSPDRDVPTAAERVSMANAKASLVSARITAEGDMRQAQAQVDGAQIAYQRAKKLLSDKAGSQRDVDDTMARLEIAKQGFEAAKARKELLENLTLETVSSKVATIPVHSPRDGILRMISSSVGQTVNVGSPLFEVADLVTLWVRVPVHPRLRDEASKQDHALIKELGRSDGYVSVSPISAPPSADALAATVDLFYELPNKDGRFHPGERVEVMLPTAAEIERPVVPRAAILRDIHGIAWVYVKSGKHTFQRHRVEVHFTTKQLAVLSRGPEVGTPVVVDGAAELFGTEFGAGK